MGGVSYGYPARLLACSCLTDERGHPAALHPKRKSYKSNGRGGLANNGHELTSSLLKRRTAIALQKC